VGNPSLVEEIYTFKYTVSSLAPSVDIIISYAELAKNYAVHRFLGIKETLLFQSRIDRSLLRACRAGKKTLSVVFPCPLLLAAYGSR
jgi:hypothetical protein